MKTFREGLENRDLNGLIDLMTEDVVFRSPAVHSPYQGREQLAGLLAAVSEVLEDWRCVRELGAPDAPDQGLVFRARVGNREVEGCDFIHLDQNGKIDEFYVMVRPLSGLLALAQEMGRRFDQGAGRQQAAPGAA
jgi:hypothetical protein